jgi:hypothetical protein
MCINDITCSISKLLTPESTAFIAYVLISTAVLLYMFQRRYKNTLKKYGIMLVGVLLFQMFTAPLWDNMHYGQFGYIYADVTWILTIAWSTLFFTSIILIDHYFKNLKESRRFFLYLILNTVIAIMAEIVVVNFGMRGYAPEIYEATSGIMFKGVPIEILYYIPVFSALVVGFYKYWAFNIDKVPVVPNKRKITLRNILITLIAVTLFELMVEPLIQNVGFPKWSYIYSDISIFRLILWSAMIYLTTLIGDVLFKTADYAKKFFGYLLVGMFLFLPLEIFFIKNGFRIYGESSTANFAGINVPFIGVPVEIILAAPMYLAIIIAFIRYWRITLDNDL